MQDFNYFLEIKVLYNECWNGKKQVPRNRAISLNEKNQIAYDSIQNEVEK